MAAPKYPPNFPHGEFRCHLCGNCCRGDGYVELTRDDLAAAAAYLALPVDEFLARYCTEGWDGEVLLVDQEDELKSCVFLQQDNTCRIHEAKPQQCKDFPFKWRPSDIMDFCHGMRAAAGLPINPERKSMSDKKKRR